MSWADECARIRARYDERLARTGPTREALAVGPEERHDLRFDVLCDVGIRSGDRVLDVGCGMGDFYRHLRKRNLDVDYLGLDLNPQLVAIAAARYPETRFCCADALESPLPTTDWVVSSTAFNLRLESMDNVEVARRLLTRVYAQARKGVAIDFLSCHADFQHPDAYHYDPAMLFTYAKTLTKRVTLRHDYPLFEFALYLYPDFESWGTPA